MFWNRLEKTVLYLFSISIVICVLSCASAESGDFSDTSRTGAPPPADIAGEDSGPGDSVPESDAASDFPEDEAETDEVIPTRDIPVDEIVRLARSHVPERFFFVSDKGYTPLRVYHDLDRNGLEDVFFLLLENPDEPEKKDLLQKRNGRISSVLISDMARLFSEDSFPYQYYLAVFLRTSDGLISMYRIPLGSWFVFDQFHGFVLNDEQEMPYCLSIDFQTHEGQESQWVVFSSYNKFSFFTLKDSISVTSETRDIDLDGTLDIVEWRKVFEEGTGYETFLSWYKWDGSNFVQNGTTNIVRNLNGFMQEAGFLLSSGKWEQALRQIVPQDLYSRFYEGLPMEKVFLDLFPPRSQPDQGSEASQLTEEEEEAGLREFLSEDERIFHMVVFPQVLENPFDAGNGSCCDGYQTRFSVRFVFRNGQSLVRECYVRMSSNPFASRQFYLEPRQSRK